MPCFDPVLCYTADGKRKFRHFSLANRVFKYRADEVFNCGQCLFCRKKRAYELACRCVLHASLYKQNSFLTLTYDEKKPGYHNNFHYKDIQDFKKRLRQHCSREYGGKKIEVFNVHEYGKNKKKHWHLIVFNHCFSDQTLHKVSGDIRLYTSKVLERLWPFGFNTIGDVTAASAMYQSQYVEKDLKNGTRGTNLQSNSKHSGIGKAYFLAHYRQILRLGYIPVNGIKLPIPRYFQRLAHRHYSHFYEKENFFPTQNRKKGLYRPFKLGEENKDIADLFINYKNLKEEKIKEYEEKWNELIDLHLSTGLDPEFIQSGLNAHYDLRKQININERF